MCMYVYELYQRNKPQNSREGQGVVTDGDVVQVLNAALHGDAVSHLDHRRALLRLQEFYLESPRQTDSVLNCFSTNTER
jgi:hypothetical protein